jgi:DNA invertase Pin-like site-specific DNA recombinase
MARKSRKNLDVPVAEVTQGRTLYNAAAYIRLSADDKRKRGDSLETQRNIIENFIAIEPDIRLVEVYSDNNTTGTNFIRPGFQRMLSDAENGRINCIITKDLTRFGRNAIDAGYYLEKHLPSLGVRYISVTDGYDSNDDSCGILLPLKNLISEAYALDISRKCRAVQRQNIAEGRFIGRIAPYGYKKSDTDCHKLVTEEETAPVVRQMFDWAVRGIRKNEIARRLSAEGIAPPCRYNFAKGFNVSEKLIGSEYWKLVTVREILTSRIYVGDMVQGKTQTVNGKQIDIPAEEWTCVPNTHEALISREVFDRVQTMLQYTHDQAETIETVPYSANAFKGKVYCSCCGYPMRRKRQNKDGTYWFRCDSQWKYGKDACTVVSVKEADLKSEILSLLHRYSEAILGRFITLERAVAIDNSAEELREINQKLDKDGRMLRTLFESMVNELITTDEFTLMKADYEAKIEALTQRADEIRNRQYKEKTHAAEYRDLADAVSAALADDKLTSEIIGRLVNEIRVHPDKSFDVQFSFADEFEGGRHVG